MGAGVGDSTAMMADFVAGGAIGPEARERAALAFVDTIGVMLAGAREPAAQMAQATAAEEGTGTGPCRVLGTAIRTGPQLAAFANGVAAHAGRGRAEGAGAHAERPAQIPLRPAERALGPPQQAGAECRVADSPPS